MSTKTKSKAAPVVEKKVGRPVSDETTAILKKILAKVSKAPGISNPALSEFLGLPTLQTSVLAKRLEKDKKLKVKKVGRGLTYYPAQV